MFCTRWVLRSSLVAFAALLLAGCPTMGPRTAPPPTVERAESLARQGDHAAAARTYEALAAENAGAERNDFLMRAAREHLLARRPEEAARVLAALEAPFPPGQDLERALLEVDIAIARGRGQQAWQQLAAIPEPTAAPAAPRYHELRMRAAFAAGRPADGVRAHVALERWLTSPQELRAAREALLGQLRDASERGVRIDPRAADDSVVRGWLELGALAAAAARGAPTATADIEAWRARYPYHPADDVVRTELLGLEPDTGTGVAHVALLLPTSGRLAAAAETIRDGFMTAYFQVPPSRRPLVRLYDTSEVSTAEAVAAATRAGADFIVGPLLREEVAAAADLPLPRPPILALNFLPAGRPTPDAFYQFALSPEDEARLVAQRILADGHRRGVALVPEGDWGRRVLDAFTQELIAGGGALIGEAAFDASQTDYSPAITQVLRLTDSRARHRRLESLLGTKLQFTPRRRGDVEFIFAASQANVARLLRPQLRFHFAGSIPTYATSDAYEPDVVANRDMEGLMFPEMPWMLGGGLAESVRAAAREAWPVGGPRRNRLFAFGFDAYRLLAGLREHGGSMPAISGLTGRLSIDSERRVRRELIWAQLRNGEAQVLQAAAD